MIFSLISINKMGAKKIIYNNKNLILYENTRLPTQATNTS